MTKQRSRIARSNDSAITRRIVEEDNKIIRSDGSEYWLARELAPVLDYAKWGNFSKVIDRAMLACKNSGYEIADHFPDIRKTIKMPKGAKKSLFC